MMAVFVGGWEILIIMAALFLIPLVLLMIVFWIWMLVDAIQNKGLSEGEKIGWVLAIVFLHLLAAVLYFFIGRPKRKTPLVTT
jgi:hypothetical protein